MVHYDIIPKPIVSTNAEHVDVNEVVVDNQFMIGQEFDVRDDML